jgi:elongation factor G
MIRRRSTGDAPEQDHAVLLGSAFKNKGVQPLLDAVIDYLPSPLDVPPCTESIRAPEHELSRRPEVDEPFSALAFKVMSDPVRRQADVLPRLLRPAQVGRPCLNTTTGRTERIGRILQMHANHREERERIGAGEIAAGVGLKNTTTGRHSATDTAPIRLESMTFPDPVISVAVEPKSKADQDKLGTGLQRLAEEDPTFRVQSDEETGPDPDRRHGRAAPRDHRRPAQARVQRRCERRSPAGRLPRDDRAAGREGRGPFRSPDRRSRPVRTRCHQRRADEARATATSSWTRSSAGRSRREYIPAVDLGIQEAMESGVLAGYPVVDIRVELVEGSYHDVDSSEMAFKVAGSMAIKEALKRGKPKLLEPVMAVEVITPEDYLGDVMGNLNSRAGASRASSPSGMPR